MIKNCRISVRQFFVIQGFIDYECQTKKWKIMFIKKQPVRFLHNN